MKIGAVFCVYNEEEYLEYAVRSILPAADRVYILLGRQPYNAYNPAARETSQPDGTEPLVDRLGREHPQITVVKGVWDSEVDHRNAGLELCLEDGMEYHWLVDGDEVYREDHLRNIRRTLETIPKVGTFIIKCHIFWRSFSYRIPAQQMSWRPRRIFKMTRHRWLLGVPLPHRLRFVGQNEMNSLGPVYEFPPETALFYHFSYARNARAMQDKFRTFSHAHEISQDWVERVWKRWPQERGMTHIHPVDPPKFPQALHIPPVDLPELMKSHPYYGREIIA